MALEIGDGLAILGGSIPVTVAILKYGFWRKSNNNGAVSEKLCNERQGNVEDRINELRNESRAGDERIEKKVDEVGRNTGEILIKVTRLEAKSK